MSDFLDASRQRKALWPASVFFLMTALATVIAVVFQAPDVGTNNTDRFRILLAPHELEGVIRLKLNNRLGQLTVEKNIHGSGPGEWTMNGPQGPPASASVVNKILDTLKDIRIRRTYAEDPISISNFSLDTPVAALTFTQSSGEEITLNIGLVNPIDNSVYVQIPQRKSIYHIDGPDINLEGMEANQFLESRVFLYELADIRSLKVQMGPGIFSLKQNEGKWESKEGKAYGPEAVQSALAPLFALKAQAIVDQLADTEAPAAAGQVLTLTVQDQWGHTSTFTATGPYSKAMPEIKTDIRPYYLVRADDRPYTYLLSKDEFAKAKLPILK